MFLLAAVNYNVWNTLLTTSNRLKYSLFSSNVELSSFARSSRSFTSPVIYLAEKIAFLTYDWNYEAVLCIVRHCLTINSIS